MVRKPVRNVALRGEAGQAESKAEEELEVLTLVGKTGGLARQLGKFEEAERLLRWALAQDVARVVVKRPVRAGYLAGLKPSHSIAGKAVRFDVHVRRALD